MLRGEQLGWEVLFYGEIEAPALGDFGQRDHRGCAIAAGVGTKQSSHAEIFGEPRVGKSATAAR